MLHLSDTFVLSAGTVTVDAAQKLVLILYSPTSNTHFLPKGRKDVGESLPAAAVRETLEESGYRVALRPHRLPTNATNQAKPTAATTTTTTTKDNNNNGGGEDPPHDPAQPAVSPVPTAARAATRRVPASPPRATALPRHHPVPSSATGAETGSNSNNSDGFSHRQPAPHPLAPPHVEPIAVQQRTYPDGCHKLVFWFLAAADARAAPERAHAGSEPWEDYEVRWMAPDEALRVLSREEDASVVRWAVEGAGVGWGDE
ncbi:hypothetical protein LOY94_002344 [Ophidiomyces ophidiicola]|uniref:Uncharacterized protein n=1 Tax=Ophidiomyces ophidiicola TaxID=1387563 RepID=A0ACB8V1B2_9EURO|nr:hypothetical protein LOZ60_002822 [Ophidiomyces ophidiicola]KAI2127533.1 hypothetical protein LOZ31_002577 [Ophidiomyces ophidiicola]KAI2149734.1 hypothetical protein LOZ27_000890 [Ophidiomyces ophidiicola]KAI2200881.1 hypothetical protein LOZ20_001538 [Ophidiomyces ophidiicola]KAI2353419.1 hypothetical protein LOY94_002344 [Ophidiomyces ophidiicola]